MEVPVSWAASVQPPVLNAANMPNAKKGRIIGFPSPPSREPRQICGSGSRFSHADPARIKPAIAEYHAI
jgi:hypothetical protein